MLSLDCLESDVDCLEQWFSVFFKLWKNSWRNNKIWIETVMWNYRYRITMWKWILKMKGENRTERVVTSHTWNLKTLKFGWREYLCCMGEMINFVESNGSKLSPPGCREGWTSRFPGDKLAVWFHLRSHLADYNTFFKYTLMDFWVMRMLMILIQFMACLQMWYHAASPLLSSAVRTFYHTRFLFVRCFFIWNW